jgi:hypothetical protein
MEETILMATRWGNWPPRKCDVAAREVNAWLLELAILATGASATHDWFDVGVFGYRTDQEANMIIESAFVGPLTGRRLVPIPEIAQNPARIDTMTARLPDEETGEVVEMPMQVPIWVDPKAEGGAPMGNMLHYAYDVLEQWIQEHPMNFPPWVIHITAGESQDGDPVPYANALKHLATADGDVLLINYYLCSEATDRLHFPSTAEILPDERARGLFEMSSPVPETILWRIAHNFGYEVQPNARLMAVNASIVFMPKCLEHRPRRLNRLR